jgi:hypothetical protein
MEEMSSISSTYPQAVCKPACKDKIVSQFFIKSLKNYGKNTNNVSTLFKDLISEKGPIVMARLVLETKDELQSFKEIWPKGRKHNEIDVAHMILKMRGLIWENLVRYHKDYYHPERTLMGFILEMNRVDNIVAQNMFVGDLHKAKDTQSFNQIIRNMFSGHQLKEVLKVSTDRTPDIIQIVKTNDWYTFVVCDPSAAGSPSYRKKEKMSKYSMMSALLLKKGPVDFKPEAPVVDRNATNAISEIDAIVKSKPLCYETIYVANTFVAKLSSAFYELRSNSFMVQHEFNSNVSPPELGCLSELTDLPSYFTPRDLRLIGLNRVELNEIFDLKTPLSFEKPENIKALEEHVLELVSQGNKGEVRVDEGSSLEARSDVFLTWLTRKIG